MKTTGSAFILTNCSTILQMRFLTILSLLLLSTHALALEFTQVASGVYVHYGVHLDIDDGYQADICNIGFVVGERGVAVIDTGGSMQIGREVRAAIRKVTPLPVLYVINTHVHPDHIFGNAAFLDDKPAFVGHEKLDTAMRVRADTYAKLNRRLLGSAVAEASILVLPTQRVAHTTKLDLGGRILELGAYNKAHTDHDLSVIDVQTGTFFSGDLLFVERTPVVDSGDIVAFIATLDVLDQLEHIQRLVPGHGPTVSDWRGAIAHERRYLAQLLADIRASIRKGIDLLSTQATAAHDEHNNWVLFDVANRRNVNNLYPVLEWE